MKDVFNFVAGLVRAAARNVFERALTHRNFLLAQAPAVNHDCLVTSKEQVDSFCALLQTAESRAGSRSPSSPFPALQIPVEWIIDICDEQNGWFIGTAYAYMEKVGDNGKIQVRVCEDEAKTTRSETTRRR